MRKCLKIFSQNSNLIGIVGVSATPAANPYVTPFTHYANVDITSMIPSGYTLLGIFGNNVEASEPMTYSMGASSSGNIKFLRVWAMNGTTRYFNCLLAKQWKNLS